MNRTIFISKLFLDALRDTHKVCKYFKLVKLNNYFVVIKIFIIKFFYSFEVIRNQIKVKKNNNKNQLTSLFFENTNFELRNIVESLNSNGHSNIYSLNEDFKKDLLQLALKSENFDFNKINYSKNINHLKKDKNENIENYIQRLRSIGISRLTATINLNEDNKLSEFISSPEILNLATEYLNTNKISINATFFISNSLEISEQEKYKNAQYFHWDNDFTKFFKMYIYLSDVDLDNGPHVFVPGTHKHKKFSNKLCRLYSDKNIIDNYSKVKKFLGNFGSVFFVDGYGIHKGEIPNKKYRLMMNIHFGRGKIFYSKNDKYIKLQ
jgi:ectoine hydroxylase-related dioxygenase (phytanoyl-CoA dioxygenase family)